jgi:aconitase B
MSSIQAEVFEAFRAIDIPEEKALKAASALSKRDTDVESMKSDVNLLKWMVGFILAFQVAIVAKLFIR